LGVLIGVFAFNLVCTAILTFSYGLFEAFLDATHVSLIAVLPAAVFFWVLGGTLARRRYE
jgi:F0F1-type ATP synthase assembly protein I